MAKKQTTRAAGDATRGLRVVSRPSVFRRAGLTFTGEPTVIPLSELTEEQVQAIQAEPMLVVTEVDIPPEPAAAES